MLGNSYVFAFYVFGDDFVPDPNDEKLNALRKALPPQLQALNTATSNNLPPQPKKKSSAKKNLFEDHQEQVYSQSCI